MANGSNGAPGTPPWGPIRYVPEARSQARPHAGRIVARILTLNDVARATTVHELHELHATPRAQAAWDDRLRRAFTARRLELEHDWVADTDWEMRRRALPCTRCHSPWVNARGYGTWCAKCTHACPHPSRERVYGAIIRRDGVRTPKFACRDCGGLIDARKDEPRGEHVFRDLREGDQGRHAEPCSRCGRATGTQNHHWAPRAIFGSDAEHWPQSPLCVECHGIWHQMMRRASGYRLPDDQRGDTLPSAVACNDCGEIVTRDKLGNGRAALDMFLPFHRELCRDCGDARAAELNMERG